MDRAGVRPPERQMGEEVGQELAVGDEQGRHAPFGVLGIGVEGNVKVKRPAEVGLRESPTGG